MTRRFPNAERLAAMLILRDVPELADTSLPEATAYRPDGVVYHVGTDDDYPDDLSDIVPYVRIVSIPAGARSVTTDTAFLDIEVFDSAESGDAESIAELLADPLRGPIRRRAQIAGAGILDSVVVTRRPARLRWADSTVSRYLLQVQVSARRTGG